MFYLCYVLYRIVFISSSLKIEGKNMKGNKMIEYRDYLKVAEEKLLKNTNKK